MTLACAAPLPVETLLAYRFDELSEAEAVEVEQHYFACSACSGRLEGIVRLGDGVVEIVRRGGVSASVTQHLLEFGVARGLRVRNYRVEPGQAIACTVAPFDDFVALHLVLPALAADAAADSADRMVIDLDVEWAAAESGVLTHFTLSDVAYDRTAGELVLLNTGREIRALPKSQWHWTAVLKGPSGETRLGPYTLNHTPWNQLAHPA